MVFVLSHIRFWASLGAVILLTGCVNMNKGIPTRVSSPLNDGVSLYTRGDMEGAIQANEQAIRLQPKSSKAHYNLGLIFLQQGQIPKAIDEFQQAIRFDSTFASAHNNLGIAFSQKGDLDRAITSFRHAIALRPKANTTKYNFNLGVALWRKGDLKEAIKEFRTILHVEPQHTQARNAIDEILREMHQSTMTRAEA